MARIRARTQTDLYRQEHTDTRKAQRFFVFLL